VARAVAERAGGLRTALRRESTDDHAGTAINTQPFLDALPKSAGWTAGGSVKVKRGDNLTGIAGQVGRPLKELEQANPTLARGHDFNKLLPGDEVKVPAKNTGPVVRPLYGVFIADQLTLHRGQLTSTLQGLLGAAQTPGLPPAQKKEAERAVSQLTAALVEMGESPELLSKLPPSKPSGSPTQLLISARTDLGNTIQEIRSGLQAGQLKGPEAKEAQESLGDLQDAWKSLDLSR